MSTNNLIRLLRKTANIYDTRHANVTDVALFTGNTNSFTRLAMDYFTHGHKQPNFPAVSLTKLTQYAAIHPMPTTRNLLQTIMHFGRVAGGNDSDSISVAKSRVARALAAEVPWSNEWHDAKQNATEDMLVSMIETEMHGNVADVNFHQRESFWMGAHAATPNSMQCEMFLQLLRDTSNSSLRLSLFNAWGKGYFLVKDCRKRPGNEIFDPVFAKAYKVALEK